MNRKSTTKRTTVTYELKTGNQILYIGTTSDPERREQEHRTEGKRFGHLRPSSRRMTEDGASVKEAEALERYRRSHSGKNPRYNEKDDG